MEISPAALSATPRRAKVFDADVTYHPLTIGDIMDWDCFAQGQYRRGAKLGMTDGTPDEQWRYRVESNDESKLICFGSAHAHNIEMSFTARLYLAWLSLRHGQPKLTLEETGKLFGWGTRVLDEQKTAAAEAYVMIQVATGLWPEEALLGLRKPKKNESQPTSENPSPTPPIGATSTTISGPSTNATPPG